MRAYLKYIFFLSFLLIILLWLMGFFKPKIKSGYVETPPQRVSGLKSEKVEVRELTEAPYVGKIEADEEAQISTFLSGKIVSVKVKEGDCVPMGFLLLTIEGESIQAQIEALNYQVKGAQAEYKSAQAHFEAAQKTYDRYVRLLSQGAVTPQEFDEVKARFEAAKETLERAKSQISYFNEQKRSVGSQLKYLNLRAPFAGCVKEKKVNVGDLALPGQPLLVFEKAPYKLKVDLPGKYFSQVRVGDHLKVMLEGSSEFIMANVTEKSSGIDPNTQTFSIKLGLPSKLPLKSGLLAKVFIPEKRKALFVPKQAIFKRYDFYGIFVLRPDKILELRYIKVGEEREDKVEVLSGLKENEMVIVEGIEKACNGCLLD